jgi:hypothetical protein
VLQLNPTAVLTLGDNAYNDGSDTDYSQNYDPTWGQFKSITDPSPGNHDYHTTNGSGYFAYFGAQVPGPYYSFDLGQWHLISLNAEIDHSAGSPQDKWLQADLLQNTEPCVLAYWHEPRFTSGSIHGNDTGVAPFWNDLYAAGADLVLNGHNHQYERFALQNPSGLADPNGVREIVAGTGGAGLYSFSTIQPNSQAHDGTSHGVLLLTLHPGSYDWKFVPVAGDTFSDSGSATCH